MNRKNLYRPHRPSPQPQVHPLRSVPGLARLSKVIGAGIENPEDLTPLQPHLSSQEISPVLDNAETILDPQGTDAQGICAVVDELSRFKTIALLITSRITTVPPSLQASGDSYVVKAGRVRYLL